jgi:hypothetical protein
MQILYNGLLRFWADWLCTYLYLPSGADTPHCYSFVMKLMMVLHFMSNSYKVMICTLIIVFASESLLWTIKYFRVYLISDHVNLTLKVSFVVSRKRKCSQNALLYSNMSFIRNSNPSEQSEHNLILYNHSYSFVPITSIIVSSLQPLYFCFPFSQNQLTKLAPRLFFIWVFSSPIPQWGAVGRLGYWSTLTTFIHKYLSVRCWGCKVH